MHTYSKIDEVKFKLLKTKIWLFINLLILLPASSYLFFVYLAPIVEARKETLLTNWFEFWSVIVMTLQCIYCIYILIRINDIKADIRNLEWEIKRSVK